MANSEISEKVSSLLATSRQEAIERAEAIRKTAYQKCPKLYELDAKLANVAGSIAAAALSGDMVSVERIKESIESLHQQKNKELLAIGLSAAQLEPQFNCKLCSDTGFVSGKRCECFYTLYKIENSKNIPAAIGDDLCTFQTFKTSFYPEKDEKGEPCRKYMETIFSICRDYAEKVGNNAGNLLLLGKTGLGKTHLSIALAKRVSERGLSVKYTSAQGLIDCFERTRFGRNPSDSDWNSVTMANNADLLIIDDMGSEFVTSFSQSVLYNIINERIMSGKETVISTNLDTAKLASTYEQRISSRVLCGYKALHFVGQDIRLQNRINKFSN